MQSEIADVLKPLLETRDLWLPALGGLVARASATRTGHTIERSLKEKLKWLREPQSEKAFAEAFESGLERYSLRRGRSPAARSAARILASCVTDDLSGLDAASILDQIFADKLDREVLSSVASRKVVVLEDALTPSEQITDELAVLLRDYLRPAFRNHPFFTERVGFSEMLSVLHEIRDSARTPQPDLVTLRSEYYRKLVEKLDVIPMQGISPKIQNQTIGIRMEDVFIPVRAATEPDAMAHRDLLARNALNRLRHGVDLSGAAFREFVDKSTISKGAFDEIFEAQVLKPSGLRDHVIPHVKLSEIDLDSAEWAFFLDRYEFRSAVLKSIGELLREARVVVRGNPGAGKSTLIRYTAWAIAKGQTELLTTELQHRLPIIIRAIEFGEALDQGKVQGLEEYTLENVGRFAPLIKHNLASGRTVLLIDGLDEISKPALRARVKERVDDFIADPVFSENHIVITTRIVGYERSGLTGRFKHFTLSDLNNDQIREFIRKWYKAVARELPDATDAESETAQLTSAIFRNESILRMARSPLLLTIIALIKWQGRTLPEQRVLLYDAAAQTLIRSWPLTQRRVEFEELFVREWLAPVAFHILVGRSGDFIDEYALMDELTETMRRLRSMTEIQAKAASREMLDNISEHSGFLLPRDTDSEGHMLYGFLHKTFAEYLAAYHMAGRWEDGELDLLDYAHDPYWREVFLLIAGHLGIQRRAKAGAFVRAVKNVGSSCYENFIHRDLLLACAVLADGTPVGPADTVEGLLLEVLDLWKTTRLISLRRDIEELFKKLRVTEYGDVLARLAMREGKSLQLVVALGEVLGPEFFVDELVVVLKSEEPELAIAAAGLLLSLRRNEALDVVATLARHENTEVRSAALRFLISADDVRALPGLVESLRSPNLSMPMELVVTDKSERLAPVIRDELKNENVLVRFKAAQLLVLWGEPRGTEILLEIASSRDATRRMPIVFANHRVLRALPNAVLVGLLETSDEVDRYFLVSELVRRGASVGTDKIVEMLESAGTKAGSVYTDPMLVSLARRRNQRVLHLLKNALNNAEESTRLTAAKLLAQVDDKDGRDYLIKLLNDQDERKRLAAIEGLIGTSSVSLLTALASLLKSANVGVHLGAVSTLAKLKEAGAAEVLASLLDDPRPSVRRTAAELMIARDEPEILGAMERHLEEFLTDKSDISDSLGVSAYQFLKRHLTTRGEVRPSRRSN